MAEEGGGYSGVTYSTVDIGYTSAEGYTGVIATQVPVGYTGSAPAPQVPMDPAPTDPFPGGYTEVMLLARPSPYESTVSKAHRAPGGQAALQPQASFPPTVDLHEFEEARDEAASADPELKAPDNRTPEDPAQEPPDSPGDDTASAAPDLLDTGAAAAAEADAFVRSYLALQHRLDSTPAPVPNRALDTARGLVTAGLMLDSGRAYDRRLVGWAAEEFDRQIAQALTPSAASDLSGAFLQGIRQAALGTLSGQPLEALRGVGQVGQPVLATHGGQYVAGVTEGLVSSGTHLLAGQLESSADPLGATVVNATRLMEAIDARMDAGQSMLGALDYVLNPFTRYNRLIPEANRIAGLSVQAERAGNHEESLRLAREAGWAVISAAMAAVDVFNTAMGGVAGAARLRRRVGTMIRRPAATPPMPSAPHTPSPPVPEPHRSAPHLDGVRAGSGQFQPLPAEGPVPGTDSLTGTVARDGATSRIQLSPVNRPHPTHPQIDVPNPQYVRARLELEHSRLIGEQQLAAEKLRSSGQPRDPATRRGAAQPIYNSLEHASALETQLAHPNDGVLEQLTFKRVIAKDGTKILYPEDIPISHPTGEHFGRRWDHGRFTEDGPVWQHEKKTPSEILSSVSSKGGLSKGLRQGYSETPLPSVNVQGALRPGSKLAKELSRDNDIFDAARNIKDPAGNTIGGVVEMEGRSLDGKRVTVWIDPDNYKGPVFDPYRGLPN